VAPELLRGQPRGPAKALFLVVELVGGDGAAKRGKAAESHDDGPADRDPGRYRKPLKHGVRGVR
jgi:hypothetical protein